MRPVLSVTLRNMLAAALLLIVLAAGALLRNINLDFGLPYLYFYDERKKLGQIESIVEGDLSIDYFRHPSFLIYTSAAAVKPLMGSSRTMTRKDPFTCEVIGSGSPASACARAASTATAAASFRSSSASMQ